MQDDIRPSLGMCVREYGRLNTTHVRPIPRVGRPATSQFFDVIPSTAPVAKPLVKQRQTAPQARLYHAQETIVPVTAPASRAEHIEVARKWLKKMRRKSFVKRVKHSAKGPGIIYAAALTVFLIGVTVMIQGINLNTQVKEQSQVLSAKSNDSTASTVAENRAVVPSEEKPKANALQVYTVAADMPRIISIDSLNVKARVLQVGVDKNNELQTPRSIHDTAWYTGSSKPGEMGAAVIDGHFVGPTMNGVFSKLRQIKTGAIIGIERGDGKVLTFRVVKSETIPVKEVDMIKVLNSVEPAKPGLNIVTCGGAYNAKSFEFADRTIVYTVLEK